MPTQVKKKKKSSLDPTPAELKYYRNLAVPWSENIDYKNVGQLVIEHKSFQAWVDEHVAWLGLELLPGKPVNLDDHYFLQLKKIPFNELYQPSYGGFALSFAPMRQCKTHLALYYGGRKTGHATFDNDVHTLLLGDRKHHSVWMSLVPNEVFTQRTGIKRAKGNVLLAGLGLGWLARKVLERSQVKHLTIVEKSQVVIDHFGRPFQNNPKVTLVCEDVYKYLKVMDGYWDDRYRRYPARVANDSPLPQFDSVLFDIWDSINDCGNDDRWNAVRAQARSAWQWGSMRQEYY